MPAGEGESTFKKTLRALQENPRQSILRIAQQFIVEKQESPSFVSRVLSLNRSSLYQIIKSEPTIEEQELTLKIFDIKKQNPDYGYRRVRLQLNKQGVAANNKRILRILQENNLLCPKRKYRKKIEAFIKAAYITPKLGINIVKDVIVNRPYQVIRTDFTELITVGGKYQLIAYLCQYTKKILSWRLSYGPNAQTAINCIKPILPLLDENCYVHQDQGSAFTSNEYVDLLLNKNLFISYSEAGTPTDNGFMESFFGRLKSEWCNRYWHAQNRTQLKKIINQAINYYNNKRIHTSIKNTPQDFLNIELSRQNLSTKRGA